MVKVPQETMVDKNKKKVDKTANLSTKKGCHYHSPLLSLTIAEKEILHLITEEFLTQKKIALQRNCSRQAVNKVIRSLKKKGFLNIANQKVPQEMKVDKTRPTTPICQPKNNPFFQKNQENHTPIAHGIRLHGQEFNIKILFKDKRYIELLKKSNINFIDGNTIRLYKNSIEVYSCHSFFADTPQKATVKSFEYWNRLFARLEHDFKISLIKPRYQNIRLVNQHYAEINNELSKECEIKSDKIRVYTTDDGKLWFTIDNSFNLHEAETLHPKTAKQDMEEVVKHFSDIRNNKPPTLSELMSAINEIVKVNTETASGLNSIVSIMKAQLPSKVISKDDDKGGYFG